MQGEAFTGSLLVIQGSLGWSWLEAVSERDCALVQADLASWDEFRIFH